MTKYTEDENGYVTFPNTPLSAPGVFQYLGREISAELEPDRIYNVYRPESELNNPETIESFKLAPWFPRHQMSGDGFTPAEDIGVQGTTGQDVSYIDGVGLVATVKTFGSKLKAAIRAGQRELSCGFKCLYELISGVTPDGVSYDVIQRNIRGNHLASVEEGRMGSKYAVAMDAVSIKLDDVNQEDTQMTLEELMAKVKELAPAKEELSKIHAEIGAMLEEGGESEEVTEEAEEVMDEDEPVEEPVMDEEKPESAAMDALLKEVKALQATVSKLQGSAMDAKQIEQQINDKNNLINDLIPHIGKIDGTGLDVNGVAKKGCDILGIACDEKSALPTIRGYIHARSNVRTTVDKGTAQDQATTKSVNDELDKLGV